MAVVERSILGAVREKVEAGERLDFDDGVALLESDDLLELGGSPTSRADSGAAPTRRTSSRTCI